MISKIKLFILFFLLFFLFGLNSVLNAQTRLEAKYTFKYSLKFDKHIQEKIKKENSNTEEKYFDNFFKLAEESNDSEEKVEFKLIANDSLSVCEYIPTISNAKGINFSKAIAKGKGRYVSDFNKRVVYNYKTYEGDSYIVAYNKDNVKWTITNEKMKIGDYECYKATTNELGVYGKDISAKSIDVWFAPSIPVSAGPFQFNGLPGLVVFVTDNKLFTLLLNSLSLDTKQIVEINLPKNKSKIISIQEYLEIVKKSYD